MEFKSNSGGAIIEDTPVVFWYHINSKSSSGLVQERTCCVLLNVSFNSNKQMGSEIQFV